jgi:hypothetical protein
MRTNLQGRGILQGKEDKGCAAICNNTLDATINKRMLDTDYNFNRNVGYVKCRTSMLYYYIYDKDRVRAICWAHGEENLLRYVKSDK